MPIRSASPAVLAVATLLAAATGQSQTPAADFIVTTELLVQSGQPAPDGNGVFSDSIVFPVLNDAGQVLVWANLLATTDPGPLDDWGFFVADRNAVSKVFRGGDLSADGNFLQLDPGAVASNTPFLTRPFGIDVSGRIVLAAPDSAGELAVYRGDGTSTELLVLDGDSVGAGSVTNIADSIPTSMQVNDLGEAGFSGFVELPGQPQQLSSLLRADGTALQSLFNNGQVLPDNRVVSLGFLQGTSFSNDGSMATVLRTEGAGVNFGIYASDGVDVIKLLHSGEPAADGLGTFIPGTGVSPQHSSTGQVLSLYDVDDFAQDYVGLFTGDGLSLDEVTRTGATSPDGNIQSFSGAVDINDNSTMVFGAFVATSIGSVRQLLMRRGGQTIPIVSAFDVLPEPIGLEVRDPFAFVLNEQDQVMFSGFVIADGASREALFLFDPEFGLALVARTGQAFAGDVLADIEVALPLFPNTMRYSHNAQNAFNNSGQQAFYYRLQNGQAGVALATTEFIPDESDLLFRDGFENMP